MIESLLIDGGAAALESFGKSKTWSLRSRSVGVAVPKLQRAAKLKRGQRDDDSLQHLGDARIRRDGVIK